MSPRLLDEEMINLAQTALVEASERWADRHPGQPWEWSPLAQRGWVRLEQRISRVFHHADLEPDEAQLYELARHAGRHAGQLTVEDAARLRDTAIDATNPVQLAGWLDGLEETRPEAAEWPWPYLAATQDRMAVAS